MACIDLLEVLLVEHLHRLYSSIFLLMMTILSVHTIDVEIGFAVKLYLS